MTMRVILRPFPVLYACAGCQQFGYSAPCVAGHLDRMGKVQMIWLGERNPRRTSRWPVFSLDACDRRCALAWLEERGITAQEAIMLSPQERDDPRRAAERIAAELA